MKHNAKVLTLFAALVFFAVVPASNAQTTQQQPSSAEAQPGGLGGDPIRQLNLTPEQREQIRSIREQNKTERAVINERLRETNRSLQAELDSDNPDEAVVEQRVRDVAAAQIAAMRMRVLTEVRIRRILTPEQRIILRSLQQQAQGVRRERLLTNPDEKQRRQVERSRALQNQRNGLGPLFPRREDPRRPRL
ncbi:MAG TPA: Spy/CpxP family protein refolding chaperone [Pyrinomonadaceae bacterium]